METPRESDYDGGCAAGDKAEAGEGEGEEPEEVEDSGGDVDGVGDHTGGVYDRAMGVRDEGNREDDNICDLEVLFVACSMSKQDILKPTFWSAIFYLNLLG